jgi:hypothetical protein
LRQRAGERLEHTVQVVTANPIIQEKVWLQCTFGWFGLVPCDDDHLIGAVRKVS